MIRTTQPRGFTLLVAIILSSVVLSLGLALMGITYKQVLLSAGAKQSQYAFYNADSALECALYYDQKLNAFDYGAPLGSTNILCAGRAVTTYASSQSGGTRTTTFKLPCAGSDTTQVSATVHVYKQSTGYTNIFANGYNTCDASNPNRIERGVKVRY